MRLYEINATIESLLDRLSVDPETGEVPENTESVIAEIESLEQDKANVLEYLAKSILNLRADKEAIKFERDRLKDRSDSIDRRIESIMNVLDRECGGVKTDLTVATLSYRKSEVTEIADENETAAWLKRNRYDDLVRETVETHIDKLGLKKLIKGGATVPGCAVVTKNNVSLK